MSLLADLLRPFWLPGLHEVTGKQVNGVPSWVASKTYQVYSPLAPDSAVLNFAEPQSLLASFAADCSRMATAGFESLDGLASTTALPKSLGWILIRTYYSAFFSAHATLRIFGRTSTQFESVHISSIHSIADLYGTRAGTTLGRGQYGGTINLGSKHLSLKRRSGGDGGSHGAMWTLFLELLRYLITEVLSSPSTTATQQVATKLIELERALTSSGATGGTWLSSMRNRINYQMAFGVWFPYTDRNKYYETLAPMTGLWLNDPLRIELWEAPGRDLQKFIEASMLIVAICRVLCQDMAARCPRGKSFQKFGPLGLLAQSRPAPVKVRIN